MKRDTVRSIGIFAAIAIILLALVVGGVRLVKLRNAQYANSHTPSSSTAGTNSGQQPAAPAPQSPPPATLPSQPAPQPTKPKPEPIQPAQQTRPQQPQQTPNTGPPAQVPVTGPTEEPLFKVALMMFAAYLGLVLMRARASYRRLLS